MFRRRIDFLTEIVLLAKQYNYFEESPKYTLKVIYKHTLHLFMPLV